MANRADKRPELSGREVGGNRAFRRCVEATASLAGSYRPGLQAMRGSESKKISPEDSLKLDGSVDIDSAVKSAHINENRWDYALGYDSKVCFVEVHPADTSQVSVVEAKFRWLRKWLREEAPLLEAYPRASVPFVWLQTSGASILPGSSQARRLSQLGIRLTPFLRMK